jgi:peptide deformylase
MIYHVARLGEAVLRKKAEPVSEERIREPAFQRFLDDLLASMKFHDGVGLAAPQVFLSIRALAVWIPAEMDEAGMGIEPSVFLNPVLTPLGKDILSDWEGCLSLGELRGMVPRHARLKLEALDAKGHAIKREFAGFSARVFQHECDHLDGIVFLDRMKDFSSLSFSRELEKRLEQEENDG